MAASLQILKSSFAPVSIPLSNFPGKSSSESDSRKRFLKFGCCRSSRYYYTTKGFRVCCEARDSDNQSNVNTGPTTVLQLIVTLDSEDVMDSFMVQTPWGEEPPESLFMKELRKRGMTPTSLLEETKRSNYGPDNETDLKEEDRGFSNRNAVSTELEKSLSNQRERSMTLNSEGLEGLIPRAKLLLTIGGTFFFGFWPLILITVAFFLALYFYFGPTFVHDASKTPISPPQYIDPYALLEEERISQIAPRVK